MAAERIHPAGYTPPRPELRHLWGSFAELRAVSRARGVPSRIARSACDAVDLESLRRATRDVGVPRDVEA